MAANLNNEAKDSFITKIINLNPENYVGCYDKKYYFWENGVQIAVALTCPKVPVGENKSEVIASETTPTSIEFTTDEKNTINKLLEALGI